MYESFGRPIHGLDEWQQRNMDEAYEGLSMRSLKGSDELNAKEKVFNHFVVLFKKNGKYRLGYASKDVILGTEIVRVGFQNEDRAKSVLRMIAIKYPFITEINVQHVADEIEEYGNGKF